MQGFRQGTLERIGDAMERYGVVAVSGLKDLRETNTLKGLVDCVDGGKLDTELNQVRPNGGCKCRG